MKSYYLNNRIFYRKNKFKKNRKTLVFVHGLSGSSSAWLKYEKKFKKMYNVLTFDLRGHGKSYKMKDYKDYSIKKYAEDLKELMQHEKIKKFVLICHSFGVFVGFEFLKKNQKLVGSAIFLSPAAKPPANVFTKILKKILNKKKLIGIIPIKKDFGSHVDYSKHQDTGDWNIFRMRKDIGNTGLKIYLWGTKQSLDFNAEKLLEKIKIPVLLVHGKKDTIFPYKKSFEIKNKIKKSKLVILDDVNHVIVLNEFDEVSKLIRDFVKD